MDDAIKQLKQRLIQEWDREGSAALPTPGRLQFQTLSIPRRPRGGLAIGHVLDRTKGTTTLHLRVTATAGPNWVQASKIAALATEQGCEVNLRVAHRPAIMPFAGAVRAQGVAKAGSGAADRRRPLHLGLSVGHEKGTAGSLGAFVRTPEGHAGILSCTHVLARAGTANAEVGDDVHQPGPADQALLLPANRVGKLTPYFAPFIPNQKNNLDAAVARIKRTRPIGPVRNALPNRRDIPKRYRNQRIGPILAPDDIESGTRVMKFGRSSGFTMNAVIRAVEFENLVVDFDADASFTFSSAIELEWDGEDPFTVPGDSGALVLTDDLRPIGLHFAAHEGDRLGYVMPIKRICDTFGLTLL